MLNRLRHILLSLMLVFSALWVAGQPAVPDTVCVGTTKKYWVTGTDGSTFTWRVNGVIQPSMIDTLYVTWSAPWVPSATPYVVTVQEQTLLGCVGQVMSSEVVVRESLPVSVDILAGVNPVCTGIEVTFTALPVNGGTDPEFSWFVNGINVLIGPSSTYSYTPADGDLVYVALASSESCAVNSPAMSTTITMMVSPLLLVEVTVAPDLDPVCAGTTVTYTASPVNGGLNPVFSWFVNEVLVQNGPSDIYSYVPADGDRLYVSLTSDAACTLNPTVNSDLLIIHVLPLAAPAFDAIGPLCQNSTPPTLPGTSLNGISGSWDPAFIDTGIAGTFSFTFTPDGGQCAEAVMLSVTVDAEIPPQFDVIPSLCIGSVPPVLETTSINGITGTWDPAVINTGSAGTTTYTFTPEAGQCAVPVAIDVTVTEQATPLFDPFGLLCLNSIPPALPDVSVNGIAGTWDPAVINTGVAGTFSFTFTPNAGECAVGTSVDITVSPEVYPQFDPIGPICLNSIPPSLSGISINGVTGSWDPAIINTGAIGTATYTFTPDGGQCAIEFRMDIEITDQILPLFDPIGPLCLNSTAPLLPPASVNGITGTWNPATINTGAMGTFNFVFTPDGGQCGIETSLDITVTDQILPVFDPIGPLCLNSTPPALPGASVNGITGTWVPATINTGSTGTATYTFTPDGGQCGVETTLDVTITDEILPTFDAVGPLCLNAAAPVLPSTSLEGITGSWIPATINTGTIGFTTYTFTPDPGQCAVPAGNTLVVEITDGILPLFDAVAPICQNTTPPALPAVSTNGITGTWFPATINTATPGTSTYTFTPDAGQCGLTTTLDITVTDEILPLFTQIGPLCVNSTPPALPAVSNNGLAGTWNPAVINTGATGTVTYTFTPDGGQCGVTTTMEITVTDEILPLFDPMGPYCFNTTAPALPATALNGITGTWVPAAINTLFIGTTTYVFTPDAGQCAIGTTLDITVTDEIIPAFVQIGPLCLNSAAPLLPLTSGNGLTGTWNPAVINTGSIGITNYTFTPDAGQCGAVYVMQIEITDEIVPAFVQIGPLCLNSTAPALPLTSGNGITGTWNPAMINTGSIGITNYTFTPDAGQCGALYVMQIEITDEIDPAFVQIGPLCLNSTAPALPLTSGNGITGTWNPAVINTGTIGITNYTFTPDAGQCGAVYVMQIEITDEIVPAFVQIGPLCLNSTAPALPLTSGNGITGTWNPAVINTGSIGITNYTFTPDAGQCGAVYVMQIEITDEIVPAFVQIGPLCLNSTAPALPLTSGNGITGTWNPAVINTGSIGITNYTFTPDAGQCGALYVMQIEITDEIVPAFVQIGPLCLNSSAQALPLTSGNGITGTWNPAVINTGTIGITNYTFTPDAGQCGAMYVMQIEITDEIVPAFVQIGPLCLNSTAPVLPLTSDNGINGTWNPAAINTGTIGSTNYTFTPDAGQCAIAFTMDIAITDQLTPQFAQIGPLCLNSIPPALPLTSLEGISGTWNPAVINTASIGQTSYTFTPDAASACATATVMIIEVSSPVITSAPEVFNATNGQPNGSVVINAAGNGLEYSYDGGVTWGPDNTHNGLFPGDYTALIRDVHLCEIPVNYTIENNIVGNIFLAAENSITCMGTPLPVPVDVQGFTGVASFELQMNYDPALLGFGGYDQVNPGLLNGTLSVSGPVSGFILITWTGNGPTNIVDGDKLLNLIFNTLTPGTANLQWMDPVCTFYAADSYPIPGFYTNGSAFIKPSPNVEVIGGGTYCEGDSIVLSAKRNDLQALEYQWTGPDGTTLDSPDWELEGLTMENAGDYSLYVINPEECSKILPLTLEVNPKPVFSIAQSDSLCAGASYLLDAGSGYESYLWQDGQLTQSITAKDAGEYRVEVVNGYGCSGASSVKLVPCALEISMPTAFTPDGNNMNDVFRPVIEGDIQPSRFHMLIYNKWGELVFETSDYSSGWDGTFRGSPAPRGIYVFVVTFEVPGFISTTLDSPVRGTVTLLR
ncbi:MAG: gliding motility-associated C-terminal domain-containing protein [Bacteroidales bacterium]|nr:gliding motility-associated C-terminal domain-containing protein [Bacteroidales bacterium]